MQPRRVVVASLAMVVVPPAGVVAGLYLLRRGDRRDGLWTLAISWLLTLALVLVLAFPDDVYGLVAVVFAIIALWARVVVMLLL